MTARPLLPEEAGEIEHVLAAPNWAFERCRVSGVRLLDEIAVLMTEYVVFPSTAALHGVVLWIVHTHAIDAAEASPRLHIKSAEKRSGKSRLLELLELLVANPVMTASMSAAALFRTIEAECPTLLIDEIDAVFGKTRGGDDRNEDLRALLNTGHRRGAAVYRCSGPKMETVKAFNAFAATALAGIGDIPSTVADRSITIPMKRRTPGESVHRFRRRLVASRARVLGESAAEWASFHLEDLRDAQPDIPTELDDRAADGWEPLLAIADEVGGDWPTWARAAAVELSAGREAEDDTVGVRLLADCRTVFATDDRLSSADLAGRLAALEEAPWGAWYGKALDARGLARMLRGYGITPHQMRMGDRNVRGYERAMFADAWARYVPSGSSTPDESLQPLQPRSEAISLPLQPSSPNGHSTPADLRCSGVAVKSAETSGDDELSGCCHICQRRTGLRDEAGAWRCSRCRC